MILEDLLDRMLSAKVGDTVEDSNGNRFVVHLARNGCRFVRLDGDSILMEQNKNKDSRFARMAREGRKIGWVIPKAKQGKWRLVIAKEEKAKTKEGSYY